MRRTKIRGKPFAVLALAAALVAAVGGCGGRSGPAKDGPLSSGTSMRGPIPNGSVCAPGGRPVAFGNELFTNYGHIVVVLDRVVLLHPHNERLIGSFAVPGVLLAGTVYWPPKNLVPRTWKYRQPVHGFRLLPGKSFDMVLGVAAITPHRATSQGMLVYYHDSSGSYLAKNYFANIIAAKTGTC